MGFYQTFVATFKIKKTFSTLQNLQQNLQKIDCSYCMKTFLPIPGHRPLEIGSIEKYWNHFEKYIYKFIAYIVAI